ncbi:MAG: ribose 5-phosphate isomerase B [Deltaproteobacteria bacterium]|nr:ribose 5-phosphate isomerase B [Deltaproteobacteria bacterium]
MKIALASDHGGVQLKESIKKFLSSRHVETEDLGTNGTDSVDYPDFAAEVAKKVSDGKVDAGVLICGTGIGMSMVANKFKGVRAAVVSDTYSAKMSKEHNNANVLCLGGRVSNPAQAAELVQAWLEAKYEAGRHEKRLQKIRELEGKNFK